MIVLVDELVRGVPALEQSDTLGRRRALGQGLQKTDFIVNYELPLAST